MTRRPTTSTPTRLLPVSLVFLLMGSILVAQVFCGCSLKSQQIAHVGLQSADLVSTYYGEKAGGVEANPLAPESWAGRIALKAAVTSAVLYLTHRMDKAGQGKVARNLLMTVNAIVAGVVINNARIAW